ncbi:hypothetical protein OG760_37220 (plasmid) [Streptomyces sp. NBC_00963]|uniref:hypothetical protein n=1 Tax=Streptomyces sp. NBC_00963 TaxID=2903697 RepID=UPI002F91770A|nr:hypothetical protein OG760_37220 [Streptomyces sp. NBC_00963]
MSPHTNDRELRHAAREFLYIDSRMAPRTASGRIRLDSADAMQENFQALFVTCLMSSARLRHPVEHPETPCLPGIQGYLNCIISRPEALEIHTNTAARIASRIMPVLYSGQRVSGIPGLRLIDHNRRRLRLIHRPTGARLDLIESSCGDWMTTKEMRVLLNRETGWHLRDGREPLWRQDKVTAMEEPFAELWARRACTPLRSAIMTRAMSIWYKSDIYPAWTWPQPGQPHPCLGWDISKGSPNAEEIGHLLTKSAIRIPHARYEAASRNSGLLILGDGTVQLLSA